MGNVISQSEVTTHTKSLHGADKTSLGKEFTKEVTVETGRADAPYLTAVSIVQVEGYDIDRNVFTTDQLPQMLVAVRNFQETREAARADAGYCGDFRIDPSPAMFGYKTTTAFIYHTDADSATKSAVSFGPEKVEFSWRDWENLDEAEVAARQAAEEITAEALGI